MQFLWVTHEAAPLFRPPHSCWDGTQRDRFAEYCLLYHGPELQPRRKGSYCEREMRRERESALKHLLSRSRKHYAKERRQDLIQFPLLFFFSQHQTESSFNHEMKSRRQKQYAQVKTEKMAKESIWIGSYDHCAPLCKQTFSSMGQLFL